MEATKRGMGWLMDSFSVNQETAAEETNAPGAVADGLDESHDTHESHEPPSPTESMMSQSQTLDQVQRQKSPPQDSSSGRQSEFARVLARRRQTVDAKGDHFTKEQVAAGDDIQTPRPDAAASAWSTGHAKESNAEEKANFYKAKQIAETRDRDTHQVLAEVKQNIKDLRKTVAGDQEKMVDLHTQMEEKHDDCIRQIEGAEARIVNTLEERLDQSVKQVEVLVLGMKALEGRLNAALEEKYAEQSQTVEDVEDRLTALMEEKLKMQEEVSKASGERVEESLQALEARVTAALAQQLEDVVAQRNAKLEEEINAKLAELKADVAASADIASASAREKECSAEAANTSSEEAVESRINAAAKQLQEQISTKLAELEAVESRMNATTEQLQEKSAEQSRKVEEQISTKLAELKADIAADASIREKEEVSAEADGTASEEVQQLTAEFRELQEVVRCMALNETQAAEVKSMIQPTSELVREALEVVQRSDKEESALCARLLQAMQKPLTDMMSREAEQRNLMRDHLREEFAERFAIREEAAVAEPAADREKAVASGPSKEAFEQLQTDVENVHLRLTAVQLETKERIEGFSAATSEEAITRVCEERILPKLEENHGEALRKEVQHLSSSLEERLRQAFDLKKHSLQEASAESISHTKRIAELEEASSEMLRMVQQAESRLMDEEARAAKFETEMAAMQVRIKTVQEEMHAPSRHPAEAHGLDPNVLLRRLERLEQGEDGTGRTPIVTPRGTGTVPVFGSSSSNRPSVGGPGEREGSDWVEAGKSLATGLEQVLRLVNNHVQSGEKSRGVASQGTAPLGSTANMYDAPGRKELERACTPVAVTPREYNDSTPRRHQQDPFPTMPNGTSSGDPATTKGRSRTPPGGALAGALGSRPGAPLATVPDMFSSRSVKGFAGEPVNIPTLRVPTRKASAPAPPQPEAAPPDVPELPPPGVGSEMLEPRQLSSRLYNYSMTQ